MVLKRRLFYDKYQVLQFTGNKERSNIKRERAGGGKQGRSDIL